MEIDWRKEGWLWFQFMTLKWTFACSVICTGTPSLTPTEASEENKSTNDSVTLTTNCTAILKPDPGFRVAILASVMSCMVILVMSVSFVICHLQERCKQRESISRSDYWRERCWDTSPKVYHLPRHIESCSNHLYMISLDGYENHGHQRSHESLMNDPLSVQYHPESQLYPLQSVPIITAPSLPTSSSISAVYLHFPTTTLTDNLSSRALGEGNIQ